jgi:hypothetical protein
MQRVREHRVPAGPLAVRWLAYELELPRAGALGRARIVLENAGAAPWRGVRLSYHWLDGLGNPIVWDGLRAELPDLEPGASAEAEAPVRAPMPPGLYRLAFDLVLEQRFWLAELGNEPLETEVEVAPRIARALAAVGADVGGQDERLVPLDEAEAVAYLAPGCVPAPDWSRRVLDAHQEGYAAVGGSIAAGRRSELAAWKPGAGRKPFFPHPLLCPSLVRGLGAPTAELEGLPALDPPADEPWLFDGRIEIQLIATARPRSGRRRG